MIRKAKLQDINQIVKLHMRNLKDGLLYLLGEEILKLFYKDLISDRNSFIFIFEESKIMGVAASTKDSNAFFKYFKKRNFLKLAHAAIATSIKNPNFPLRYLFSGNYPKFPSEELLTLFVGSGSRGKNIGTKLVKSTTEEFKKMKSGEFKITILSTNNRGKEFYKKNGFEYGGYFKYLGESREIYVKKISK